MTLQAVSQRASERNLTAADVMTRAVVTAEPEEPIGTVAERMAHYRVGALPVVDEDGTVLGLLTANDIVWLRSRELPQGEPATIGPEPVEPVAQEAASYWYHLGLAEARRRLSDRTEPGPEATVSDIYSRGAITVDSTAPIDQVARMMSLHRIHHLIVLHGSALAGVISALDVVRAVTA